MALWITGKVRTYLVVRAANPIANIFLLGMVLVLFSAETVSEPESRYREPDSLMLGLESRLGVVRDD